MGYKEDFISIYQEHISREGSKELLEWLQTTDFFYRSGQHKISLRMHRRIGAAQRQGVSGDDGKAF